MHRNLNRVRMILKCVYKNGIIRVGITFFSCSVGDFSYRLYRWLYIVVMQFYKSGYAKVGFEGVRYKGVKILFFLRYACFMLR